jgi:FlaA1/EpsC-like NDP-sugar epimerase
VKTTTQTVKYIVADFLAAGIAWTILFVFRKRILESAKYGFDIELEFDQNYYLGLCIIPVFWIGLYWLGGHYTRIYRRHRLKEFGQVLWVSAVGVLLIFFVFLLDDQIFSYKNYYQTLLVLFISHFSLTLLFRLFLTSRTVAQVHSGKIGFNTIIVGGNERALGMYEEIQAMRSQPGFRFVGFVRVNGSDNLLSRYIPHLGNYEILPQIIRDKKVEEVIIAVESTDHNDLERVMSVLEDQEVSVM